MSQIVRGTDAKIRIDGGPWIPVESWSVQTRSVQYDAERLLYAAALDLLREGKMTWPEVNALVDKFEAYIPPMPATVTVYQLVAKYPDCAARVAAEYGVPLPKAPRGEKQGCE